MTRTAPARYLVLEGGEGVGKTTQTHRLARRLEEAGRKVEVVREPGGDPFAEAGRALLLGDLDRTVEAEVLAFNAMRAQVLRAVVQPLLAKGVWVVGDRGRLSTLAYQGHGEGADLEWTRAICDATVALCPAQLEVVLSLDATESSRRRTARGTTDRFERRKEAFHRRVAEGYRLEAARLGVPVVDAAGTPPEVTDRIWAHAQELLR